MTLFPMQARQRFRKMLSVVNCHVKAAMDVNNGRQEFWIHFKFNYCACEN